MVLATIGFVTMQAGATRLTAELPPFEVAFFRCVFGSFALVPFFVRHGLGHLRTTRFGLHALRGTLNGASMLLFFAGLATTPLPVVTALNFTSPLFATLLAIVILGEKVRLRRLSAVIVGFIGAVITLNPAAGMLGLGPILILLSAGCWALVLVDVKVLSRTDSSLTITAWQMIFLTPVTLVAALFVWQWPTLENLLWLAVIGSSGTLAHYAMTEAFRHAEATLLMPFDYCKLLWSVLYSYFLLDQGTPGWWVWLGGSIIFVSTTYIALREHQLGRARVRLPQGS